MFIGFHSKGKELLDSRSILEFGPHTFTEKLVKMQFSWTCKAIEAY